MEPNGASFFDEEWESLNKYISTEDSDNFLLHVSNLFSSNDEVLSNIMPTDENSSNQVGAVHLHQDESSYTIESMDFYTMCNNNGHVFLEDGVYETVQLNPELSNEQATGDDNVELHPTEDSCNVMPDQNKSSKNPKKRTRVSRKPNNKKEAPKTKKPRKNKKAIQNEEQNKKEANGQTSSTGSLEEAFNPSQELSEELSESKELQNLSKKARTNKASATDPQSLYARRRRERINERLKVLQNLVPNGTKVDLSTMLEEAVHYVKFLQLQIKLLSSDDMWMYASVAYNGMNMGFYQSTMVPNLLSLHS